MDKRVLLLGGLGLSALVLVALSRAGKSEGEMAESEVPVVQTKKPLLDISQVKRQEPPPVEVKVVSPAASLNEAYDASREILIQVSRYWPGLRALVAELEAAGVKPALDAGQTSPPTGVFEETDADVQALARGVAVRFHPSVFHHVQSLAPYEKGPGEHAGRVFVDAPGAWWIWRDGWKLVPLAPEHLRLITWDALFSLDGRYLPHHRRQLNPIQESQWIAAEQSKKAQNEEYVPKPPPILVQGQDGSFKPTVEYDPSQVVPFEALYPLGLAKGDSDRVVQSVEIHLPTEQRMVSPSGPTEKAQTIAARFFPV